MDRMDETLADLLDSKAPAKPISGMEDQNKGYLPEGEALHYFFQLLKGLREIHNKKVMHRDLKPDNLFISGSTLYIGDFNLSTQEDLATSNVGTAMYKCPLIVTEKGPFAHYVDLWSCGLILYRMLYGVHLYDYIGTHRAYRGSNDYVTDIGAKIRDQGVLFPRNPSVTEGTKDLIKRMLNIDTIKDLTADQLLRSEVFSKYFETLYHMCHKVFG